jgi:hypothetical protein
MAASLAARVRSFTFERFATALFLVAVVAAACLMPAQTDTWWQLRAGEEMWKSHHVMLHDQFSHTVSGAYWPNHEWLAQLAFYAAYRVGGLPLLTALCGVAVTTCWAVVATLTPASSRARLVLLGAGAILTSPAWSVRPQVFSLALLAIAIWIIVDRRRVWTLAPLFVMWANLHGGVALGIVLLGAAVVATGLVDRARFRRTAILAAACLLCTAATPLGFTLWAEVPLSLARLHAYGVIEWQRPGLALADLPFWAAAAAMFVLLIIHRSAVRSSFPVAFLGVASSMFFLLALQTRRNIPPFVLCAVPLLGTLLQRATPSSALARREHPVLNVAAIGAAAVLAGLIVAVAWAEPSGRLGWNPVSDELRRAVTSCPGRLYNRYDDGGYLIWFARDKKVFIDSRQDPYPRDMVSRHIQLERTGQYKPMFARYDIACALTTLESPLAVALARDGWQETSGAGSWAIFARPPVTAVADRSSGALEPQ